MWFDNALHKEMIEHMFGGFLPIEGVELSGFYFYAVSSIRFSFKIKGLPSKHPKKWSDYGYNAISLVLSFDGVRLFESSGNRIGFSCDPCIETLPHAASISVKGNEMKIYCESEFLTIS